LHPAITKNSIVIFIQGVSSTTGIVRYQRNGKLVGKIGNWGRGPAEYMSDRFAIDDETGKVFILDNGDKIKVYSSTGNFIRNIPLDKYGDFRRLAILSNRIFVFNFPGIGPCKYNWIALDTLGNLIKTNENSLPLFVNPYTPPYGNIYKFDNKLCYWSTFNDTVYSLSPDLKINKNILFEKGPHRWPAEDFTPPKSADLPQIFAKHLLPAYLFETRKFYLFYYNYLDKNPEALIDKRNGEARTMTKKTILNDIDGGTMFYLASSHYFVENGNEYLAGFIEVFKLKTHIASATFQKSNPRDAEKKKELEKFVAGLNETDNPVLMIVRLKK